LPRQASRHGISSIAASATGGGGWPHPPCTALATEYVSILASDHNLDLKRVVTIGHSAGGHLALWLAARGKIPAGDALFTGKPLPLRAAISLAGVSDLRRGWEMGLGSGAVEKLIGGTCDRGPAGSSFRAPPLGVKQFSSTAPRMIAPRTKSAKRTQSLAPCDDATLVTLQTRVTLKSSTQPREFAIVLELSEPWDERSPKNTSKKENSFDNRNVG
jgi:pimeloyl-ACP methyl ester carboxylesterase